MKHCNESELLIQKLVDEEMSSDERRAFLRTLERDSPRWREIALAFVEEQIWNQQVGAGVEQTDQNVATLQFSEKPTFPQPTSTRAKRRSRRSGMIAALCLVLAIFLGVGIGRWSVNPRVVVEGAISDSSLADASVTHDDESAPPYRLRLASADGSNEDAVELPVYDSSAAYAPLAASASTADSHQFEQFNRALEDWGYRVDWKTEYLSGELKDGRKLIVPVREAAVQYYGQ